MEHKHNETPEKLDFFPLFRNLWKQFRRLWWLLLILALLGGAYTGLQTVRSYRPMYQSEAIFSLSADYSGSTDIMSYNYHYDNDAAQLAAAAFPYLLNSDVMKERLLLKLDTAYLNGTIEASSIPSTNFFVLTAKSADPADAYAMVKAVMEIYPQVSRLVIGSAQMVVSQEPTLPDTPYTTLNWTRSAVLGAAAGALLGFLFLLLLAVANPTVITEKDIRQVVNLPCLAQVPNVRRKHRTRVTETGLLTTTLETDSAFTEAFRLLRLKLLRTLKYPEEKVLLFTSSLPSEGKSSLAANTALSLAKDGKQVLLIDGDLRAQNLKVLLGVTEPSSGLAAFLSQNSQPAQFLRFADTSLYLFAGDETVSNPTPLLKHDRLDALMRRLREHFDYIIIDTPPCAMMADAAALCRHADQVIYVIREDYASRAQILDGVQALSGSGASICGYALNRVSAGSSSKYGYGYGYKYGYGYPYSKYGKYSRYARETDGDDAAAAEPQG